MGSGGIIILVLFAVSWIVQAIAAQANKKKEQERLADLARRRREQEAARAQQGMNGGSMAGMPSGGANTPPPSGRPTPIPQPFGSSPTTAGRAADDLAARRAAQIEELRRRREAQLEQMRRRQGAPAPSRPSSPSTVRPSSPPPGMARQSPQPAGTPSRATFPTPPSAAPLRPLPRKSTGTRTKREESSAEAVPIDAAYAQPESSVATTLQARQLTLEGASLRDPEGIRRAFVLKELLDLPLALRPSDQDRRFAW